MRGWWPLPCALASLLALYACALFSPSTEQGEAAGSFPHGVHMQEPVMGCGMCHETASGEVAVPESARCLWCHEAPPAWAPAERTRAASYAEVRFSHGPHAGAGLACDTCHGLLDGSAVALRPDMEACLACHRKRGGPLQCAACHERIRTGTPPDDHRADWMRRHGKRAQISRALCVRCHEEQEGCLECHEHERPASHTIGWKLRDHGARAAFDRERCATCHRSDECDRCHQVRPPSHLGSWRWGGHARDARSKLGTCLVCHQGGGFCGACHPSPF